MSLPSVPQMEGSVELVGAASNVLEATAIKAIPVALLVVLFICICRTKGRLGGKAKKHVRKSGCERENVAVPVTQQKQFVANATRRKPQREGKTRLSDLIKQHANDGNLEKMVQTMESLEERFPLFVDLMDYDLVIGHLAKGGDPSSAHNWLRRSAAVGLRPLRGMFNTVIHAYVEKGAIKESLTVVDDMRIAGVEIDDITYNAFIQSWLCTVSAAAGHQFDTSLDRTNSTIAIEATPVEKNEDMLTYDDENVEAFGMQPEQLAANATQRKADTAEKKRLSGLLKRHEKDGNLKGIAETLEILDTRFRAFADIKDYHGAVICLAKGGDPVAAHKWLRRCIEIGLTPKQGPFNSVMNAYAKAGAINDAMYVFEEMKSVGLELDTVTYNTLIDAWRRAGDAFKAQYWMNKMLAAEIKPNVISFSSVLLACAGGGLLEDFEYWFEVSQRLGFQLNYITFDSAVRAFAQRGDADNAMKWLTIMIQQGVTPTLPSFVGVLGSVASKGDVKLAEQLMDQMRAVGVQPDGLIYSRAIAMAANLGHLGKAQDWANQCEAGKGGLTWTARQALAEAGLRVPQSCKSNRAKRPLKETVADGDSDPVSGTADSANHIGVEVLAQPQDIDEARRAAVGKRYSGIIKDFCPRQFGFISCDATFQLFRKDVFVGRYDNPDLLTRGQRVSFTLRVDEHAGVPRAADIKALPRRQ